MKRFISLFLAAVMLLTLIPFASFSALAAMLTYQKSHNVTSDGKVVYTSYKAAGAHTEDVSILEFNPKDGYIPLAFVGKPASVQTIKDQYSTAKSLYGYEPIAVINGGFFTTATSTLEGMVITNRRLIAATVGSYGLVAFGHDGSMNIVTTQPKYTLTIGSNSYNNPIYYFNKDYNDASSDAKSSSLFYNDYYRNASTSYGNSGVEVVFEKQNGTELAYGKTLIGKVVKKNNSTTGGTSFSENQFALFAKSSSTYASALSGLAVGDTIELSVTETNADAVNIMNSCTSALSNIDYLVKDGKDYTLEHTTLGGHSVTSTYARWTAYGVKADGTYVLLTSEGGSTGVSSRSLTLRNVANILLELGCVTAVRLDGGGSTGMYLSNTGSGSAGYAMSSSRSVADCIVVVKSNSTAHDEGAWVMEAEYEGSNHYFRALRCTECGFAKTSEYVYMEDGIGYQNLATNKNYTVNGSVYSGDWTDADSSGKPTGKYTDGVVSSSGDSTANGCWSGNTVEVTIDLEDVYKIKNIRTDLWGNTSWGISMPNTFTVTVFGSTDNVSYTKLGNLTITNQTEKDAWTVADLNLNVSSNTVNARYIKYSFNQGGKFLWVSELRVYGAEPDPLPHVCAGEGNWEKDSTSHWKLCSCGEKVDISSHDSGTWVTTVQAGVDMVGTKELRCTICAYVLDTATIPATHDYGNSWKSNSTSHWQECACGEKANTASHDSGAWVTTVQAGVDKVGTKELRCTVCAYVLDTATIPATHDYGNSWKSNSTSHWQECACGEKANTASHDSGAWVTTVQAGVDKVGTKELRCTVCAYVLDTATIPATHDYGNSWKSNSTSHWQECACGEKANTASHDSGAWVTTVQAGVDKVGTKELRCTVCAYVLDTATIPATHDYGEDWKTDKNNHWHECGCGEKSDISAHDNGTWVTTVQAGVDKVGTKELRCTVCAYVLDTATIPATHDYGEDWKTDKNNHWHECGCGEKSDISAHDNGTWVVVKQAEVDAQGKKELRCTVCGYVLETATIPAKHSFGEAWVTDANNHWHECGCGEKSDVSAHDNGTWVVVKQAEIDVEGKKELRCTICQYVLDTATIPAKHSFGDDWKSDMLNHWHECGCGETTDVAPHTAGDWEVKTPATLEKEGEQIKKCTVCSYVLESKEIPKLEPTHTHSPVGAWSSDANSHWHTCSCGEALDQASHDDGTWVTVKEADIDVEGKKELRCTVCGYVLETATIPAKHSFGESWVTDANNHWHECDCGEKSDVASHDDGAWVTVKEADIDVEGKKELRCTVCNYVLETATIPAKHSFNDGWQTDKNNHWHECDCGEKSDVASHTAGDWEVKTPATTQKAGEQIKKCTVCSYILETKEIPKLEEAHKHTAVGDWKHDETGHWKECSCGEKVDFQPHTEENCDCGYEVEVEDDYMLGDVNKNGEIDSMDYVLVKRAYFGTFTFDDDQFKRGDVNKSGEIDSMDYVLVKRAYFGTFQIK